jgi:hypothetical protein
MSEFWSIFSFSLSVTGPILIVLAVGIVLRKRQFITDEFIHIGSRLVFTIALPTLLFLSIVKTHISQTANISLVAFGAGATILIFIILEVFAQFWVKPAEDRGVVVQGGFRSNLGIIGLAYGVNAYGTSVLAAASLYLGLITILLNILSVITLSRSLHKEKGIKNILLGIFKNPLILAILIALPISWAEITLPKIIMQTGEYFAQLTLPLALLCTGASLDFHSLRQALPNTLGAAFSKLIFVPTVFVLGAMAFGFKGMDMGILLLMASSPTAAASYVMTKAMGGNATLAANIIALTTLGSLFTTSLGIMWVKGMGLM